MKGKRCESCFREYEADTCPYCGGARNEEHQLPVGTLLRDRYQIGRVLGQGGFGITYIAWDVLLHRCIAVKEFFPQGTVFRNSTHSTAVLCCSKDLIGRFESSQERVLREAQALVKFQDIPEVVSILDLVKENNTTYIIMEYVRGVDLAKYVRIKGGKLTVEETFRILRPVMEALTKVHRGGIVHRDISPDNIILDPMGGAKLLDFGAVKAVDAPDVDKDLNKSTEAILKQGFAPIEQYNSRGSLGPWTDEYAMCATVWYCLTGQVPEDASTRLCDGIDPDWSTVAGLAEHQRKALQKGFSCRAKDRYRDIDALLEALFPEEEKPAVTRKDPAVTVTAVEEKTGTGKGGKKSFLWIAAAAAVLIIVIAAVILLPGKQETTPPPGPGPQVSDGGTAQPGTGSGAETTGSETETTQSGTEAPVITDERYLQAEQLLADGKPGEAAIAFGKLDGLSDARERSFDIWAQITDRKTVATGTGLTIGIRTDGTAVAAGASKDGRNEVSGWTDLVAVSAGVHTVGLRADGTVVAAGLNDNGQCNVSGWTDIVAISAGSQHTVGLRADGTVVATGVSFNGECNVSGWTDIVAISAGEWHTVGLRADGTVVAAGSNSNGQCNVSGWTDIVAISAGSIHTVGLRADGTVVAVGYNEDGRCDVSWLTDAVAISAGYWHTAVLRADGTAVAVGNNTDGRCDVLGWTDLVDIHADLKHTAGLRADGTVVVTGSNEAGQCDVSGWPKILLPRERVPFR